MWVEPRFKEFEKMEGGICNLLLISVVKNEADHLEEVIEGVLKQSLRPRHWLILDDFSRDETPRIIGDSSRLYPWISCLTSPFPEEKGYSLGWHIGRVKAHAAAYLWKRFQDVREPPGYMALLDGDVLIPPNFFEASSRYLEENRDFGMVSPYFESESRRGDQISGGALVIREDCYRGIGGLVCSPAFDSATMAKGKMLGWEAGRIKGLTARLLRATSAGIGPENGFVQRGQDAWYLGFPFYVVFLRGIAYYLKGEPARGRNFIKGYLRAGKALPENIRVREPLVYRYFSRVRPLEILGIKWRGI